MPPLTSASQPPDMHLLLELEADPPALERHYRGAPEAFAKAFEAAFAQRPGSPVFQVWHARLAADVASAGHAEGSGTRPLLWAAGLVLLAGTLAKLPALLGLLGVALPGEAYYARNAAFFVLPPLAAYFLHLFGRSQRTGLALAALFAGSWAYASLLPGATPEAPSDTAVLALLHLPVWLWGLLGVAFVGTARRDPARRLLFLRYNGELLVYTALVLLAAGLLSGLTIALFAVIGLDIAEGYMENVALFGLPGVPVVATLLATTRYGVTERIAPVIARLFSPLALVALVVYLGALLTRGADPFRNREVLLVLNAVLLAVLALVVFTTAERGRASRFALYVGAGLLAVAVALDLVALSSIVVRLADGLTPNRLAVLGANVLVLIHLALLLYRHVRLLTKRGTAEQVERAVAGYLALYVGWAALVTFGFPLLFGFA